MRPQPLKITVAFFLITLQLLLEACRSRPIEVKLFNTAGFVIADTAKEADQLLALNDNITEYPIYYIGPKQDTFRIGRRYISGITKWKNVDNLPFTKNYSSRTLSLLVDTAWKTDSPVEYYTESAEVVEDSTLHYQSFICLINNISDSMVLIGDSFSLLLMRREAQDEQGNWVEVDKMVRLFCGTGEPWITLKSGEYILAKVRRYKGTQMTAFRLVFGQDKNVVYSNVFYDYFDLKSFQQQTN